MISKDTIQKIEDAADIVSVVSDFVKLKKQGTGYVAPCPFHGEKTASFHVSASKNVYKCFGCGKGGNNAISFVMEHEKYTYPEALRWLANKFSIEIEEDQISDQAKLDLNSREEIFLANEFAQNAFIENLNQNKVVLQYLKDRQLSPETIAKFKIGYAPEEYRWLFQKLTAQHLSKEVIFKSDLAYDYKGKVMDKFRERVIFPIHNVAGKVIGFGGRIIDKDSQLPKYVNTSENEVYQKRDTLYGLYFAKKAIAQHNVCNMVEGYLDVISLHQDGIENTVASSGTSLTLSQVKSIKRYTNSLNILYDSDAAGLKAAARGLEIAIGEGMSVRIVSFPQGEDPDSFIQAYGADVFKKYIKDNRSDIIDFFFRDWSKLSPADKDETGITILRLIAKIPLDRNFSIQAYVEKLAKIFNAPVNKIKDRVNKVRTALGNDQEIEIPSLQQEKTEHKHELEFVGTMIMFGHLPYDQHKACYYYMMERAGAVEDFLDPTARLVFSAYYDYLKQGIIPTIDTFLKSDNPKIVDFAMILTLNPLKISDSWNIEGLIPEKKHRETVINITGYFRIFKFKEKIAEVHREMAATTDPDVINDCFTKDSNFKKMLSMECKALGIKAF